MKLGLRATGCHLSYGIAVTQYNRLLASYCRLSVCLWRWALWRSESVWCWMLYLRVPKTALHIHFFRHFCCRIYRSATTHGEKPNRQIFRIWSSHGQRGHVTMATPDAPFSALRFCSYTVRRTQYDRPSCGQLCFLFCNCPLSECKYWLRINYVLLFLHVLRYFNVILIVVFFWPRPAIFFD